MYWSAPCVFVSVYSAAPQTMVLMAGGHGGTVPTFLLCAAGSKRRERRPRRSAAHHICAPEPIRRMDFIKLPGVFNNLLQIREHNCIMNM